MTAAPGLPGLVVTATISEVGVLRVWGLDPSPQILDEGAPAAARNELVNLLHAAAVAGGQVVCAAARTPAGPWYFACDASGVTSPLDPERFAAVDLPELDGPVMLAGAAAVLAAAASSPPAAMLALASDPDPAIRAEALAELATWPDDPTPVADAELPTSRLERLAGCSLAWVRVGVAANPGTGTAALAALVADPDPQVAAALAARFDLPVELLVQLAAHPDPEVAAELGRNPAAAFLAAAPPPSPGEHSPADTEDHPGEQVPAPPTGAASSTRRPWPRSRVAAGAAAGLLLLAGAGYAAASALDAAAPAQASSTAGVVVTWNGMTLPAGPDGPTDPAGDIASGFAHTELGAAMAAAHLSVRIDPYAGPASFEPTITGQTYGGDPAALLAATQARYRALGGDGGPIPTSTAQITGWRIDAWTAAGPSTVHLRVVAPGADATDYGIAVVWVDGDYRLLDPTRADTFTTSPAAAAAEYRSFS